MQGGRWVGKETKRVERKKFFKTCEGTSFSGAGLPVALPAPSVLGANFRR